MGCRDRVVPRLAGAALVARLLRSVDGIVRRTRWRNTTLLMGLIKEVRGLEDRLRGRADRTRWDGKSPWLL
jgi:hypothetical protein